MIDAVATAISEGLSSTTALAGSTEAEQFYDDAPRSNGKAHAGVA